MDALRFMHEHRNYFEDFVTRSTYHSNAIEGNTLSYAETYAVLWNDNSLKVSATARELHEAINHKYALDVAARDIDAPLTERLIKRVAKSINRSINEIDGYRKAAVFIRGAEHLPPEPNQVNQLMMRLVHEYNHDDVENPFLREARFHIRFERIHPFEDGNGRTGRILINRGLMRSALAPAVIPIEDRSAYMELLAKGDAEGLAGMLGRLSEVEAERIQRFAGMDDPGENRRTQ